MITEAQEQEGKPPEEAVLKHGLEELAQVQERIGLHFRRSEARTRAGRFLRALLAPVERKNGWQLAEELSERSPHGVQRLLAEADWDEQAVRDELRRSVVEHLGDADGVLVVDETGFLKKGKKSAGVANQYSGAAHGLATSQVGVFLLYASGRGIAFLDQDLYVPEQWLADPVRCREAGIPEGSTLTSKGELAKGMLARAFAVSVGPRGLGGRRHALRLRRTASLSRGAAQALRVSNSRDAPGLGRRAAAASRVSRGAPAGCSLDGALGWRRQSRAALVRMGLVPIA